MASRSLPPASSSFTLCSARELDSAAKSDGLLSLPPSFSFEFLPSGSPEHCGFPPGGAVEGGEGTGLVWERFGNVLLFEVC